jgi:hypothetical protein
MNYPGECEKKECMLTGVTRYLIVVVNGTKNPHRSAVAKDITDAILQTRSSKGVSAVYWNKEEQERRLTAAFEKWAQQTDVWSAAAPKVRDLNCLKSSETVK